MTTTPTDQSAEANRRATVDTPCQHFWQVATVYTRTQSYVRRDGTPYTTQSKMLVLVCAHCTMLDERILPPEEQ